MTETHSDTSFHVCRDLLQHYNRKYEEKANAKLHLQDELEFKQGELANERRMRQWLETRLDSVVHALASKEGTQRYKDEYKGDDLIRSVLAHTKNDLMNEKRLREKLEETVAVIERAKDIEQVRQKYEGDAQIIVVLQSTLETTDMELIKEKEMVRVLEETIADLEKPIVEEITKDDDEEEEQRKNVQQLENAQREYMAERKIRQKLQRKLAELEAAMPNSQADSIENVIKTAEDAETLERVQDDLLVERSLRQKLVKKLKTIQVAGVSSSHIEKKQDESKEEENMLQTLLKCTLDKLSNERQVRRTLEEKLEVLEQTVMKEQARTKLEEICLELTQNELSQEREVRLNLEQQLASLEAAKSDSFIALPADDRIDSVENFEERLDALDKIIMSIKAQNKYYVEEQVDDEKMVRNEETLKQIQQRSRLTSNDIISLDIHDCLSSASSAVSSTALSAVSSAARSGVSSAASSECTEVSSLKYCMEMMHDETLEESYEMSYLDESMKDELEFSPRPVQSHLEDTPDKWQMIETIMNATLEPEASDEQYNPEEMKILKETMPLKWKEEKADSFQTNEHGDGEITGLNTEEKLLNQAKLQAGKENETDKERHGVVEVTVNIALPLLPTEELEINNKTTEPVEPSAYPSMQDDTDMNTSWGKEAEKLLPQDNVLEETLAQLGAIKRRIQEPTEYQPVKDNVEKNEIRGNEDEKFQPQDNTLEETLAEMGAIKRRKVERIEYHPLKGDKETKMSRGKEDEKLRSQDNTLEKLAQLGAIMKRKHKESKILNKMGKKDKLPSVSE